MLTSLRRGRTAFVTRRLGQTLLVMWIVATAVFFLFRILPGDPARSALGPDATEEAIELYRQEVGLDRPLPVQYADWLAKVARGDLGIAITRGRVPIAGLLVPALGRTLELAAVGMAIAITVSVPLGVTAAVRAGSWIDRIARAIAVTGFSLPGFWLGILLLILFGANLRWFPIGGYADMSDPIDHLRHLALPALCVGIILTGILVRFVRSSMVSVLDTDYVRTAFSKGVRPAKVYYWHALRNASISLVTVVGLQFGLLVGGLIVIEQVFAWPGVGWLMVEAVRFRDYSVVQGAVLVSAAIFVIVNLIVDLLYIWIDPRISYE